MLADTFLSADSVCKQIGPRSGPTERWSLSGSEPFDTLIFLKKDSRRQKV